MKDTTNQTNRNLVNLDYEDDLRRALDYVMNLGIDHAKAGAKALTQKELSALVKVMRGAGGQLHCRNGHSECLKRAYGAAFIAIKLNQRVSAKATLS